MVVILNHAIVAAYLYYRDKNRFIVTRPQDYTAPPSTSGRMGISEACQDAVLRLSGVVTFDQLEEALRDAIELVLPNVSDVIVYLLSPDNKELTSSQGLIHTLPKEGLAWDAVQQGKRLTVNSLDGSDPVSGLLKTRNTTISQQRKVVCSPVVDRESDRVLSVFVIVCDELTNEDHVNLTFIEKQLVICHKRLKHINQLISLPPTRDTTPNTDNDILQLCSDLYDQDSATLQVKVLRYLMKHTNSESGFLLMIDKPHREMFVQVIGETPLKEEIRFPADNVDHIFARLVRSKQVMTLEEIGEESTREMEGILNLKLTITSMLCVPVVSQISGDVVSVACLVNKYGANNYTSLDIETVTRCFKYTTTVLHSTLAVQNERKLKNQTQALLQVARNLFTHLDDLTKLLREIMQEARNLTKAERCSVFLMDEESDELVAAVFDGEGQAEVKMQTEVRIPANQGIAGHVATTGEILNIDDAYTHPLFYRGVDESTGFRTRNILCFPIKNENGEVIGVAQLCNKINGSGFTSFDMDIAQAFSVYCCISIVHSMMYKKVWDAQQKSRLSNELMIYHMLVDDKTVNDYCLNPIPTTETIDPAFSTYAYIPRSLKYEDTAFAVMAMFEDMGMIQKYRIKRETLTRFVLMVRRGYREPPYHNWAHAFAVAHFCYLLYKNVNLLNYIDEIEMFALFVACLCHDLDHRGTTNSFQASSGSTLASLYSSEGSILERHHFAQAMCIINTEGCNILENLTQSEYERVIELVREIILATDLGHHLKILPKLHEMADNGYVKENKAHRSLLLSITMTASDLSDQTKTWKNTKKIAELIYQEFFSQGDMEKKLGHNPITMMDRERACVPELQVDFLDNIALPVYRIITKIFPSSKVVVDVIERNRRMWVKMNDKIKELQYKSNSCMDVLQMELDIEDESDSSMQNGPTTSSKA